MRLAMQRIENKPNCFYNLTEIPADLVCMVPPPPTENWPEGPAPKWGIRDFPTPPPIGTRVKVRINHLGVGTVQGYFSEHGWFGVHILPEARPEWHLTQNGDKNFYLVFGVEIAPAE